VERRRDDGEERHRLKLGACVKESGRRLRIEGKWRASGRWLCLQFIGGQGCWGGSYRSGNGRCYGL
jgi:hypothetical protein